MVGACGLQPFLKGAVIGGELADALLERGVFGGDPLDSVRGEFVLGVAELAEQLPDAGALRMDLGVGVLEGVFGVECPLPP